MRFLVKRIIIVLFMVPAFPAALLCCFGRFALAFSLFAETFAFFPGIFGEYARTAFYCMTLRECSLEARVGFGSLCAHRETTLKAGVCIGGYVVLGKVTIGERSLLASHVQVLSGMQQHSRDADGRLLGPGEYTEVSIGSDCWIGAGAIIMADLGDRVNIGAGSVVASPVASGYTASGNPARSIRLSVPASAS
jgi:acetyltransferase-like isoleucine patch superfamily enzyme